MSEGRTLLYQVKEDDGHLLDARAELDAMSLTLRTRSGNKAQGTTNTDYAKALRLILQRMAAASIPIERAYVDSYDVRHLPINERTILRAGELTTGSSAFTTLTARMRLVGQKKGSRGGNATRRLRITFARAISQTELVNLLGLVSIDEESRQSDRLPAEELGKVTAENVWAALGKLRDPTFTHPFRPSVDFDLITSEGERFAPKAVFGVAATEALGFQVLPKHFSGGIGTPCFRILERAGFPIVPKNESAPNYEIPDTPEDREWCEGNVKLVTHLVKERARGLAQAKKAAFIRTHGRLTCEECGLDPQLTYDGDDGVACIEVHHNKTAVADMDASHPSKLDDLRCVCANCHRVIHRRLKNKLGADLPVSTSSSDRPTG